VDFYRLSLISMWLLDFYQKLLNLMVLLCVVFIKVPLFHEIVYITIFLLSRGSRNCT